MHGLTYSLIIAAGVMASAAGTIVLTAPVEAGTIERACLKSERAASSSLCGCIQRVADITLSSSDQRKAARFFKDPQRAQDVRMSDRRSDESFWDRYQEFGNAARAYCASS